MQRPFNARKTAKNSYFPGDMQVLGLLATESIYKASSDLNLEGGSHCVPFDTPDSSSGMIPVSNTVTKAKTL